MIGLALAIVAIALPDSLNPSLIVAEVYLALSPHPFRRTLAFTIAAFAVTLAGGVVIALGLGDLVLALLPKLSRSLKYELMTLAGVSLIIAGGGIWWRRGALADSEPPSRREPGEGPGANAGGSAFLLGAGIAGVEFLTAFPYFAAIAMIVGSSTSTPGKVFLLLLYNVVYVLPLIGIAVLCGLRGDRAAEVVAPVGDWIAMRWPLVAAPLVAAAGVGVTTYALIQLL